MYRQGLTNNECCWVIFLATCNNLVLMLVNINVSMSPSCFLYLSGSFISENYNLTLSDTTKQ